MRTQDLSSFPTRARRRAGVLTVAAVLTAGVLLAPTESGQAVEPSAPASPQRVTIVDDPLAWKPSANARLKVVRTSGSGQGIQVKPRRSAGRKNISVRSPLSTDTIETAGSIVTASARIRTSQPGRRLRLRVVEIHGGRIVTSRSVSLRPSSTRWRAVKVTLRTSRAGSRIQVSAHAKRVRGTHLVRVSSVDVTTLDGPTDPGDPGDPGTPPTQKSCEDIDYSKPDQGVRTFTEDFSGTTLNRATWRVRDDTFLNQDQAWITKDAVSVHDGYLDIEGRRLPQSQWRTNTNATYPENRTRDYSTGYIDTIDDAGYGNAKAERFGQKYGHFEVRAWVPSAATMSRGIWPAFWLRADHKRGEIDPLESYGAPTIRNYDPSSSYEWNSWHDTLQEWSKDHTHGTANVGTDKIWQGWHTFGVNWSPHCLRYLYDGKTVGLVDFDAPGTKKYFRGDTFDDTFHIRLNLQVGTKYWGWAEPKYTRDSFNYKVDWVRVHQGKDLLPTP